MSKNEWEIVFELLARNKKKQHRWNCSDEAVDSRQPVEDEIERERERERAGKSSLQIMGLNFFFKCIVCITKSLEYCLS